MFQVSSQYIEYLLSNCESAEVKKSALDNRTYVVKFHGAEYVSIEWIKSSFYD